MAKPDIMELTIPWAAGSADATAVAWLRPMQTSMAQASALLIHASQLGWCLEDVSGWTRGLLV